MKKKYDFSRTFLPFLRPIRNGYTLVFLAFAIWMIFFDANNVSKQLSKSEKLENLNREKIELQQKIDDSEKELGQLKINKEKYAREQYYMKKDDEDVFVIDIKK